jgi:hypothetical protein
LPLFTGVRGRIILRSLTPYLRSSEKFDTNRMCEA